VDKKKIIDVFWKQKQCSTSVSGNISLEKNRCTLFNKTQKQRKRAKSYRAATFNFEICSKIFL
jgi:hypothetical protein